MSRQHERRSVPTFVKVELLILSDPAAFLRAENNMFLCAGDSRVINLRDVPPVPHLCTDLCPTDVATQPTINSTPDV